MLNLGRKKVAVGVDIGSGSFRVAKLVKGKNKPMLTSIGSIRVPRGAIVGGEIVDVDVVANSLSELWKKTGIREKEVVLGIANQRTIVRLIDFPYIEKNELSSAIQFQAQDFIPIPIEDVILDYQVIGEYYSESGDRMLQILLVAAQKGMIETFVKAAEKAGLKPSIIDVNAFAAARSLSKAAVKEVVSLEEKDEKSLEERGTVVQGTEEELKEDSKKEEVEKIEEEKKEEGGESGEEQAKEIQGMPEESGEKLGEEAMEEEKRKVESEDIQPPGEENASEGAVSEESKKETSETEISDPQSRDGALVSEEEGLSEEPELYDYSDEQKEEPEIINDGGPEVVSKISSESSPSEEKEVTAIIDVGAGITNIVILEDEKVKFVRIINTGGDDWTEAIVELMGIPLDEAEELKVRIGLPPLSGDKYIDVPSELLDRADEVFSSLEREVIKFIGEIRRSFEYYTSQSGGSEVREVIVSGGASSLKNFTNYMERGLGVKVYRGDPLMKVEVPPRVREQLVPREEGSYSIAIGLALRGLE